ncbi:hypothetical protein [Oribacterium sp. KHPX15]|nr:hypothetical protein [Oribacterium sp. KHPX15]
MLVYDTVTGRSRRQTVSYQKGFVMKTLFRFLNDLSDCVRFVNEYRWER